MRAYRVLGRKATAARARGIEGLRAEMVGRADEMQVLQNVVNDLKQGVGRIVCVLGEAGLGKSRLIAEAHAAWETLLGPNGNWFETGSLSYESGHAYGLFQRLIRNVTGIGYDDPPALVREKLAPLVEGFPEAERTHHWQVLEVLFGLADEPGAAPIDGDTFKRELFELMHDWWRERFAAHPTVLVFDDMHWSDAASVDLLRQLLPLSDEIPLVLLCAMRAERQAPAWQIKLTADEEYPHRYSEIVLRPLSDAESTELVNRLLSNPTLPERLLTNILEKSGGNPFFIEEVVRTLIDSGAVVSETQMNDGEARRTWRAVKSSGDFAIPDTLQSLLAARMDRLEESTRGTLQIASVIGRSFYQRVLQAVDQSGAELDKRLSTLLRLEMIREAARVPEVEYAFRNPLTQEAVYQTILLKRRRDFHRRVGEAMEAIYPDRLERLYGLLAHHFALAGLRDKAIHYYRQAAHQAITLYAYDDAVLNLHTSLALIAGDEASEAHVLLLEELGDVYRLLRDGASAIAQYQAALDLCQPDMGSDPLPAVRLHRKTIQVVSDLKWSVGVESLQQANECRLTSRASLVDALQRLQSAPAHAETVRVLVALSTDAWRIEEPPDWESAQRFAQQAVDMARQLNDAMELSQALGALANVLDGRSLLREHLQVVEQRLALCGERDFTDIRESIEAHRAVGAALMYVGEYEKALPYLREAEEQAERGHVVEQQVNAIGLQAQCWFRLDRWDDVLASEERWRTLERQFPRERVGET